MKAKVMVKDGESGEMHVFFVKFKNEFYWYKTFVTDEGETLDLQVIDEDGKQVEDSNTWSAVLDAVREFQDKSTALEHSPFYLDSNA